ncbi:MAG: EamA family transporter RarD [Eikenella sp.]|nr:EamA family transporter RarD [Eikenella sp.]
MDKEYRKGLVYALICYLIWGLFPIYWMPLLQQPIGADQLLAQRIVWATLLAVLAVFFLRKGRELRAACAQPKTLAAFAACALVLGFNWLLYLYAITRHQVLQASLGYFICPLISVLLGRLFLGETLGRSQQLAIACAAIGVLWLATLGGQMPWLALGMAVSFGFYGLIRKLALLPALTGFALESLILFPFALLYLFWQQQQGSLVFSQLPALPLAVVVGSGVMTMAPLLLFAAGARRIRLSTLGMVQYISPTLQFVVGLALFGEAFDLHRFAGYLWVWAGVGLFIWGSRPQRALRNGAAA